MREKIKKMIERFPEHAESIKALGKSSARFRDLLSDFHGVEERLQSRRGADDPGSLDDLERRHRHLRQELVMLIQGYPLA
ncbi:MAG: hypothetical protein KDJ16_09350 [Hyphomicrobiales bacterium]|nr:hypothetical protein [Hyphomicrobiales bacterium]